MNFGEIKKIEVRDIWKNEATEFTPWLEENIHILSDALGIDIEIEQREAEVGNFSLDLLDKNLADNSYVVIENQFGPTDHDHLGKLLTYSAAYEASTIILIAESIRDEHRQALEWLNKRTDKSTDFFAVTIETFQIDDSKPAVKFVPVVFPNEWQKNKKNPATYELSDRYVRYQNFFQLLIDKLRDEHKFTNAKIGQPQSWYSFSSGISGYVYSSSFNKNKMIKVEIYIDCGDKEKNKYNYDQLYKQKESIESDFGEPLGWERLDDGQASRIFIQKNGHIYDNDETLESHRNWMIKYLLKFKSVMPKYIKK